ncbi:MAG: hypothetical protein ACTSSK_10155, partial [Candidatus Heimdallarchaeota archaeon]
DRTSTRPDSVNLEKVKNDLSCKEAEAYLGPWELAEIRTKKKSTWVYAWNDKLKSLWVLEFMDEIPAESKINNITLWRNPWIQELYKYGRCKIPSKNSTPRCCSWYQ